MMGGMLMRRKRITDSTEAASKSKIIGSVSMCPSSVLTECIPSVR